MSEKTYEMLWDCRYCGAPKNLGVTHRHCPNCGGPQDPRARYFPADSEKIAVQDHKYVGADVVCPACNTANSRAANNCGGCGSPLGAGKAVQTRQDRVLAEGAAFQGETVKDARAEFAGGPAPGMPPGPPPGGAPPEKKGGGCAKLVLGLVILMLVLGGGLCLWNKLGSKQAGFEVAGHTWKRTVAVERYGDVEESAWCSDRPAGAQEIGRSKEQRSTKKEPNGEDCKTRKVDQGDGTFKEKRECTPKFKEVPVYDDKCRYRVKKWSTGRTEAASGASLSDRPRWPAVNLSRTGTCDGCEREGTRTETYTVRFLEQPVKKEKTCDYREEGRWSAFAVGSRWTGKVGGLTGGLDCDSLAPAH